jgi:hypothetical protein
MKFEGGKYGKNYCLIKRLKPSAMLMVPALLCG